MLKKACNDTCVFKANSVFGATANKKARIAAAVAILVIAIGCHLWGQNQRSYIYLDGQMVSSESQTLPISWGSAEIGSTGIIGSASYSGGTYTVAGSGADIWDTTDAFRFAYQRINGDVTITARVVSQTNTSGWAKAGVMIRNSLDANAAHAFTYVTPSNGLRFQYRSTAGGTCAIVAGPSGTVPYWVRLRRAGNTFTSYVSTNGTSWTLVSSQSLSMSTPVYVGLAVTAHNNAALSTATFDNVSINALPYPWESSDIGSTGMPGSSTYTGTAFAVAGSGADIWGASDSFRYVYLQATGNVVITARVVSLTNTDGWAKAGVMIRNGLAANAANAFTLATPINGIKFQHRITAGGTTAYAGSASEATPHWIRLLRVGNTFTSYWSVDGASWNWMGYQSITMAASVYVGLAVTAHNNAAISSASFDNVTIQVPNPAPTVTSLNPTAVPSGNPAFVLNIYGSGFMPSSWVMFHGNPITATYISESQLQATITAAKVAAAGYYYVSVLNPEPGGGESNWLSFIVHGQPTCLNFSSSEGFAGNGHPTITVCNAPNMSIEFEYQFTPWGGGAAQTRGGSGTTDSAGAFIWYMSHYTAPGNMVVTKIRNAARSDWYMLSAPYPTFTIRPPKPTTFSISPVTLYLPGGRRLFIGNSESQTIIEEYNNPTPPGGTYQYPLVMNPLGYWSDPGYVPCGFEPTGTYTFLRIRNQLDSGADAWTTLTNETETLVQCSP